MQQKVNRQLIVYLSKSLKTDESKLVAIREHLIAAGFLIHEYKGGAYHPHLREEADFMLLVPYDGTISNGSKNWETRVGKGQFGEAVSSMEEEKPTFIYMGHTERNILMSKADEGQDGYWITNRNDWKGNYGRVKSYVRANGPIPLYDWITGHMSAEHNVVHLDPKAKFVEFPLTPNEAYASNFKLLLLN